MLSGSLQFTGGFTNHGVIHGRVTQGNGVTTVSALVPSDFNEDGRSDIMSENVSGQVAVSEMNGITPIGGGAVSSNPGPSWKAIATGDFNGDGHSDILWQNVDGQASIWEMDGNTRIGGGAASPNPGPNWTAVGTGDFNGDGLSDILWQNADGQASIWEMVGSTRIGGGAVTPKSGTELESGRNRRLQRRWGLGRPVAERQRPGLDLGNGRRHPDRRRGSERQSRAGLESDRDGRLR